MKRINTIDFEEHQNLYVMNGVIVIFNKVITKTVNNDLSYSMYNNEEYICSILNNKLVKLNENKIDGIDWELIPRLK